MLPIGTLNPPFAAKLTSQLNEESNGSNVSHQTQINCPLSLLYRSSKCVEREAASLFCWARGAFCSSGGRHLHSRAFQFWKHFAFHHFGIFCWLSDALFISFIWGLVPWNVWTFDINKRLSTNWFILFGVSKVKLNKRNQQIVRPQYCPFSEVTDLTNCLYIDIISFWEPPSCCFVWFCLWVGGLYGL